jgi:hypothetical protein
MQVMTKIQSDKLYDDPLFIDYVKGKAMISMSRVYSFMTFSLPGGAAVNASAFESQGNAMIDKVLAQVDGVNTADYFLQVH